MILTIAKKELLATVQTSHFLIAFLLSIALIPAATYIGVKDYQVSFNAQKELQQILQKDVLNPGATDARAPEEYNRVPQGNILSEGLEFPSHEVSTSKGEVFRPGQVQGRTEPRAIVHGRAIFLFVVSVILSMLAFISSAITVPAQKLDGELRFTLAAPVSRFQLLMGKILGNYAALLLPFLAGLLLASLIASFSGVATSLAERSASYLLAILLLSLLFLFSQLILGIYVTVGAKRTSSVVVRLLFVWAIFSLVIPRMSPIVAEIVHPTRSSALLDLEKLRAKQLIRNQMVERLNPSRDPEQFRLAAQEYQSKLQQEYRRIEKEDSLSTRKREDLVRELSLYSPVSCYAVLVSEISSAGVNMSIHEAKKGNGGRSVTDILADRSLYLYSLIAFAVVLLVTTAQRFHKYDVR